MRFLFVTGTIALAMTAGCAKRQADPSKSSVGGQNATPAPKVQKGPAPIATGAKASVGQPAPEFALPDLSGKTVRLSDHRGKVVVLEWFNPDCPFVQASHTKGSLIDAAKKASGQGVVWLAVNSGAPGKQGHGLESNHAGKKAFSLDHPILLDETGAVGQAYGAKRTPHMFVIDDKGVLVYRGAVDNSPDGEGESPTGDVLIRHVDEALVDLKQGRAVRTAETEAYGCTVKYAQ